jgi:hypothetical protein
MSRPRGRKRDGKMTRDMNKHVHLYPSNSFKSYDIAFSTSAFHNVLDNENKTETEILTISPSIRNRQPPNLIILNENFETFGVARVSLLPQRSPDFTSESDERDGKQDTRYVSHDSLSQSRPLVDRHEM